ncbi:MAG: hypothetical protein ACO1NX_03855 [Chitinophagaceae bacterium]
MKYFLLIFFASIYACQSPVKYPDQGYSFPLATKTDTSFYFHPIKDSLAQKDSFQLGLLGQGYIKSFQEPNLSLRPLEKVVFRLLYFGPMVKPAFVTLTENEIIVKQVLNGSVEPTHDESKLDAKERAHFTLLKRFFPFRQYNNPKDSLLKRRLDSVAAIYPELNDPAYYQTLLNKSADYGEENFAYSTKVKSINKKTFKQLAERINASGYWSYPHRIICQKPFADGFDFILEANTPNNYKVIFSGSCPGNDGPFTRACQALIDEAGLGKEIQLITEE